MDLISLANLVVEIVNGLRQEGQILDFGRDYELDVVDLFIQGPSGDYASGALFHALHDADQIYRGDHADTEVEVVADEAVRLLKKLRNWRALAFQHSLRTVFVTVKRGDSIAERFLYTGSGGGSPVVPDDPLIVF